MERFREPRKRWLEPRAKMTDGSSVARMAYRHHGRPPYGRNRQLVAENPPGNTGGIFMVLRASDKSVVNEFEKHDDATAAIVQLESTTGEKYVIRKR
jgi:hypothetical protein